MENEPKLKIVGTLSKEETEEIIRLHSDGCNSKIIADKIGRTLTIVNMAIAENIKTNTDDENKQKIIAEFKKDDENKEVTISPLIHTESLTGQVAVVSKKLGSRANAIDYEKEILTNSDVIDIKLFLDSVKTYSGLVKLKLDVQRYLNE